MATKLKQCNRYSLISMVYMLTNFHVENYCGGNRKKRVGAFSTRRKYKFKGRENTENGIEKTVKKRANNNSVRPKSSVHSDHVHLFA